MFKSGQLKAYSRAERENSHKIHEVKKYTHSSVQEMLNRKVTKRKKNIRKR